MAGGSGVLGFTFSCSFVFRPVGLGREDRPP
jgi:hypothetical protein